jgi:hypothetical protein
MSGTAERRTTEVEAQVLLVEDNHDDALLIRRAFRKAGLAPPVRVKDGDAAVTYLPATTRSSPNLVTRGA